MAKLVEIEAELSAYAGAFDASTLLGSEAAEVVRRLSRMENLIGGPKLKAAARVAGTPIWKHQGHRTPAEWLARETRCGVGEAVGALETAEKLADCPKVAAKVRSGELTAQQARALVTAVAADPAAEDRLLGVADRDGLKKLKEQCRQVELASRGDAQARHDKIHRERSMRHWTDDEGAFRLAARLTPEAGRRCWGRWRRSRRPPSNGPAASSLTNRTRPLWPTPSSTWPRRRCAATTSEPPTPNADLPDRWLVDQ
jgi:polyhydroxyalkanoate synthesis regulator phasin